jgi:hypothetical protein
MDERQGQNIYYSLNTTVFQELLQWVVGFCDKEDGNDE